MSFPAQPYNNPHFNIKITHIPTSRLVTFDGWVTQFQDSFSSEWNETSVYGRMDPLATFQRTGRKIQLSFDVVARSQDEAALNDSKINTLIQFLYPVYESKKLTHDNVMTSAPLLVLKWANLAANSGNGYGTTDGANQGVVGYLAGLDYSPNMEAGTFFSPPVEGRTDVLTAGPESKKDKERLAKLGQRRDTAVGKGQKKRIERLTRQIAELHTTTQEVTRTQAMALYHQQISLNLNFTVLHTHLPGWVGSQFGGNTPGTYNFPHGGATRQDKYSQSVQQLNKENKKGETIGTDTTYGAQQQGLDMTTNTPKLTTNTHTNDITAELYQSKVKQILKGSG